MRLFLTSCAKIALLSGLGGALVVGAVAIAPKKSAPAPDRARIPAPTYDQLPSEDGVRQVMLYRKAKEQGDAEAQYALGLDCRDGKGSPKDDASAVRWFILAAKQGHPKAQYEAGEALLRGMGVDRDEEAAARWLRLSAKQDFAPGQRALGQAFSFGWGVAKNLVTAEHWLRKAAEQGDAEGQLLLACLLLGESDGDDQKAAESAKWLRLAAEQDLAVAQYHLAISCRNGVGLPPDAVQACMWLNLAAQSEPAAGNERFRQTLKLGLERMKQSVKPQEWETALELARKWRASHSHP